MGKHRYEDTEKGKADAEFNRRSRKAILTPGKRPKLTKSDTDEQKLITRKLRFQRVRNA